MTSKMGAMRVSKQQARSEGRFNKHNYQGKQDSKVPRTLGNTYPPVGRTRFPRNFIPSIGKAYLAQVVRSPVRLPTSRSPSVRSKGSYPRPLAKVSSFMLQIGRFIVIRADRTVYLIDPRVGIMVR